MKIPREGGGTRRTRGAKEEKGTRRAVNQAATRHSLRNPAAISLTFADLPARHPACARVCVNNNARMQKAHRRVASHCDSGPRCEPKAVSTVSARMIFSVKNILLERDLFDPFRQRHRAVFFYKG